MGKEREQQHKQSGEVDYFTRGNNSIHGVLFGELPTKSNQRRIFNGISIKSQKALDFVRRVGIVASYCLGPTMVGATSRADLKKGLRLLYLKAHVFGDSFQRDLDCELLPDALQEAGLINNDRAIREKHYFWTLETQRPRVVFEIGYLS